MTDCDFDPTLPECQPADEIVDDGAMEEPVMMEEEDVDLMGWTPLFDEKMPLQGQMTYTFVALGAATMHALKAFRYRSTTGFYDAGKGLDATDAGKGLDYKGPNWWSLMNMLNDYGNLALWSVLGIFNLISTFGIAVPLNGMVWGYASFIFAILNLVVMIVGKIGYDAAYSETPKTNMGLQQVIQSDMFKMTAMETATMLALYMSYENWAIFQDEAAPEEEEVAMEEITEEEGEDETPEEEVEVDPFALFQF
jgi:hypothetical protein